MERLRSGLGGRVTNAEADTMMEGGGGEVKSKRRQSGRQSGKDIGEVQYKIHGHG